MEEIANTSLVQFSSFGTGGSAEQLFLINDSSALLTAAQQLQPPIWVLGQGTNCLISDRGLPGTVLIMQNKGVKFEERDDAYYLTAEAGADWDTVVQQANDRGAWGIELMSGIPGTVGAAVAGNIAAYGQAVADSLHCVYTYNLQTNQPAEFSPADINLAYRSSDFLDAKSHHVILRAVFKLPKAHTKQLEYHSALTVLEELSLDIHNIVDVRKAIIQARVRAWAMRDPEVKTAGSFFKNPMVTPEQAREIFEHEEQAGRTQEHLKRQNQLHGGSSHRVSAALVLLAAGFKRGQSWGPVRLHSEHILKVENTGGATSQQIYEVGQEIIAAVKEKLDITLEPEVRFLGEFN